MADSLLDRFAAWARTVEIELYPAHGGGFIERLKRVDGNKRNELLAEYDTQGAGGGAVADFIPACEGMPLPEPRGYAWLLNNGNTEYTEDEHCPVEPTAWSLALALYDADQLRAFAKACRPVHPSSLASDFTMEDAEKREAARQWVCATCLHPDIEETILAALNVTSPKGRPAAEDSK